MTPDEAPSAHLPVAPWPHGRWPQPQPQLLRAHWAEQWAACAPRAAAGWVLEYSGGTLLK